MHRLFANSWAYPPLRTFLQNPKLKAPVQFYWCGCSVQDPANGRPVRRPSQIFATFELTAHNRFGSCCGKVNGSHQPHSGDIHYVYEGNPASVRRATLLRLYPVPVLQLLATEAYNLKNNCAQILDF